MTKAEASTDPTNSEFMDIVTTMLELAERYPQCGFHFALPSVLSPDEAAYALLAAAGWHYRYDIEHLVLSFNKPWKQDKKGTKARKVVHGVES